MASYEAADTGVDTATLLFHPTGGTVASDLVASEYVFIEGENAVIDPDEPQPYVFISGDPWSVE